MELSVSTSNCLIFRLHLILEGSMYDSSGTKKAEKRISILRVASRGFGR